MPAASLKRRCINYYKLIVRAYCAANGEEVNVDTIISRHSSLTALLPDQPSGVRVYKVVEGM